MRGFTFRFIGIPLRSQTRTSKTHDRRWRVYGADRSVGRGRVESTGYRIHGDQSLNVLATLTVGPTYAMTGDVKTTASGSITSGVAIPNAVQLYRSLSGEVTGLEPWTAADLKAN